MESGGLLPREGHRWGAGITGRVSRAIRFAEVQAQPDDDYNEVEMAGPRDATK